MLGQFVKLNAVFTLQGDHLLYGVCTVICIRVCVS